MTADWLWTPGPHTPTRRVTGGRGSGAGALTAVQSYGQRPRLAIQERNLRAAGGKPTCSLYQVRWTEEAPSRAMAGTAVAPRPQRRLCGSRLQHKLRWWGGECAASAKLDMTPIAGACALRNMMTAGVHLVGMREPGGEQDEDKRNDGI